MDVARKDSPVLALLACLGLLGGCAAFGEGVGRAVMSHMGDGPAEDTRACEIEGPAFPGTLGALGRQAGQPPIGSVPGDQRAALKVMMVHGIGTHEPGYSGTLSANLSRALGLDVTAPQTKSIEIQSPTFPGEVLGTLTARRFTDAERVREMIFYELTWSRLSDTAKARIAYDASEVVARQRASFNRAGKSFVNDVAPDPLVYVGAGHERILTAVRQGLCWAYSEDWDGFPAQSQACLTTEPDFGSRIDLDDLVLVTHSLGSRIVLDALQSTAELIETQVGTNPVAARTRARFQNHSTTVFMLANQLPLLQAGFGAVATAGQIPAYCRPDGARFSERLFQRTDVVAFNDPNDLMSYPILDAFVQQDMDARLCPAVTNVTVNIATVTPVLRLGEFANPLEAHSGYDGDERVIGLIAGGLGQPETLPVVNERCSWIRTDESLR